MISPHSGIEIERFFEIKFIAYFLEFCFRIIRSKRFRICSEINYLNPIFVYFRYLYHIFFRVFTHGKNMFCFFYCRLECDIIGKSMMSTDHFLSRIERNRGIVDCDDAWSEVEDWRIEIRKMHEIEFFSVEYPEKFCLFAIRIVFCIDEHFFEFWIFRDIERILGFVHKKHILIFCVVFFEIIHEFVRNATDTSKSRGEHATVDSDFHGIVTRLQSYKVVIPTGAIAQWRNSFYSSFRRSSFKNS